MSGSTSSATQIAQIQFRRAEEAQLVSFDTLELAPAEALVEVDTGRVWIGTTAGKVEVITVRPDSIGSKGSEGEALQGAIDGHLTRYPFATRRTLPLSTGGFRDLVYADESSDPITLDLPSGRVACAIHYTVLGDDETPLRSGILRVVHTGGSGSEPPALTDMAVGVPLIATPPSFALDPETMYGWIAFRAVLRGGATVLQAQLAAVPDYEASASSTVTLLLRVERHKALTSDIGLE